MCCFYQPYFYIPIPCMVFPDSRTMASYRSSHQKVLPHFKRGKVKNIVFDIEYPDGSTKTTLYKNADKISHIIFNSNFIPQEDLKLFNVSEDWRKNPTFISYEYPEFQSEISAGLTYPGDVMSAERPRPRPLCTSDKCGIIELPDDIFKPGGPLFDPRMHDH